MVAPTLVPEEVWRSCVKTDRRGALKLARSHRSDDLTAWYGSRMKVQRHCGIWYEHAKAAKQDQLRARHRLSKFPVALRPTSCTGRQGVDTDLHMAWIRQIRFAQMAQESTRLDYLHEVEHMGERAWYGCGTSHRRGFANLASPEVQEVINGLQALRGIAHISAVTIAAELGQISRFKSPRQLMGYSGAVPSEDSSGERTQRGSITRTGNAHLRRIAASKRPGATGSHQASDPRCCQATRGGAG